VDDTAGPAGRVWVAEIERFPPARPTDGSSRHAKRANTTIRRAALSSGWQAVRMSGATKHAAAQKHESVQLAQDGQQRLPVGEGTAHADERDDELVADRAPIARRTNTSPRTTATNNTT
jgi:hypothetical protein